MRHHFFSKNPKNQPTQKFEDGTLIRFYNIENYYRPKCICVLTLSLSLYLCICLFVFVFYSLGCIRTWGQTEEPNTEPFAMDKEKFAIHFFSIFNDFKRIFLAWGLGVHINIYCGCQKNSPFHFFVQITVIFQSQFLNLEPCLEPMTLLKIFKRQFLYFFNSENPSSCQQQWWNI